MVAQGGAAAQAAGGRHRGAAAVQPLPGNAHLDFVNVPPGHLEAMISGCPVGTFHVRKTWPGMEGCSLRCCSLHTCTGVTPAGPPEPGSEDEGAWLEVRVFDERYTKRDRLVAQLRTAHLRSLLDGASIRAMRELPRITTTTWMRLRGQPGADHEIVRQVGPHECATCGQAVPPDLRHRCEGCQAVWWCCPADGASPCREAGAQAHTQDYLAALHAMQRLEGPAASSRRFERGLHRVARVAIQPLCTVPPGGEMALDHRHAFVACNCGRCGLPLHPQQ
ncbi:hypothetical protein ABPG75_009162 [Micractinium tetrahymenae]